MTDDSNSQSAIGVSVLGKLPRFNGKTSIVQFLKTISKRSKLEKWKDDDQASIIRYLCTDNAEAFLDANPELSDCSLKDLTEGLLDRFKPKISKAEAFSELMSLKQNRDSIDDYAGRLESKAASMSDVLTELSDPDERDELLMSVFIAGLNPHLQRILTASEHSEFSDLVRAAKRCEKTFPEYRRHVNAIDSRDFPDKNKPWNKSSSSDRNRLWSKPNFADRPKPDSTRSNVQCYGCGEWGHIRRFCNRYSTDSHYNNSYQSKN